MRIVNWPQLPHSVKDIVRVCAVVRSLYIFVPKYSGSDDGGEDDLIEDDDNRHSLSWMANRKEGMREAGVQ